MEQPLIASLLWKKEKEESNQMARKKRKKGASQQPVTIQAPLKSSKHPTMWLITGGLIFLCIAIALFFKFRYSRSTTIVQSTQSQELIEPPDVNLKSAEKEVAQKIERLRKDVVANPKSFEAWGRLGMNLDAHDFKQQAVQCYQQAARLTSDNFKWSYYCAIALNDLGSSDAIDWFGRCIKIKKDYAPLYVRYGNALYDLGRTQEAARHINARWKSNPKRYTQ